jgi:uncharacterized glyoxalase superfamily protein PhnB
MSTSTSTQTIFPALRYRDAARAIDWLEQAFGFGRSEVHAGHDGSVHDAELRHGGSLIMLGQDSSGDDGRLDIAHGPAWLYVVVDDPDAHFERARAAGAEIVRGLVD